MTHFIITYHISLVNVQTNYRNKNLLILDVKQLNKIMKRYYFYTLKALWDGQGKIKVYYGMSRVKKRLSGKKSITDLDKALDDLLERVKYFTHEKATGEMKTNDEKEKNTGEEVKRRSLKTFADTSKRILEEN